MRLQYQVMDTSSGVGVLDKAAIVLSALEAGPSTLAQLVTATGLARPTAHRLAVALEHQGDQHCCSGESATSRARAHGDDRQDRGWRQSKLSRGRPRQSGDSRTRF